MFEKVSRAQFLRDNEGKTMTLIIAGILSEKQFNRLMETWENEKHVFPQKVNPKYTGILHKYSRGFYREREGLDNSYYFFERGSYIERDGEIYLLIRPLDYVSDGKIVKDYQVAGYRRED